MQAGAKNGLKTGAKNELKTQTRHRTDIDHSVNHDLIHYQVSALTIFGSIE